MKKENPYQNFSSFVLRSPLFPLNFIQSFTSGWNTSEDELKEVCKNPVVDEALFLASPDLHTRMHEWLDGNLSDKKKESRLQYALMRYILRMCTRPTPFGLFAGFNVGKWTDENEVQLPSQEKYSRHTRLDMNYLCALAQDLANHPDIKTKIKYYPNTSIYPVGEQLRYVEYRYRNAKRTHHIVAVDRSEYLERILKKASQGAYLNELAALLVSKEEEITLEEASEFIEELVSSQLLVNDLEPAITGPEFLDQILDVLKDMEGIDDIRNAIIKTRDTLQEVDNSKIGTTVDYYSRIAKDLEPLGTKYELKFLFQTDMVKPVDPEKCVLDWKLAQDVLSGIEVFNRLTNKPSNTNMDRFREAFYERYETREVSLLQALDTEAGVGYLQTGASGDIAPLVDDLALPGAPGGGQDVKWNAVQSFLFQKYREAIQQGKSEIEITDEDVERFEASWDDLPDSTASMTQIVGYDEELDRPRVLVSGMGGSSAGNLLGRFCHADEPTDKFVREITAKEGELNPEIILAEIIHLPESRIGNVVLRPVLREYEIPYLAKAAVPEEFQLKLDDLMVSVRFNRVMLRSKRLNKFIIPRLTNAHNYSFNALPIYHFLADLQSQALRPAVGFNWGALTNEYNYTPRVTYRNLIFSPASWVVRKDELKDIVKIKDDRELNDKLQEWRKSRNIPAQVLLVDSDNKLYINLENTLCIRTLFSVTRKRDSFQLDEFLYQLGPNNEHALVKSPDGVFTNEVVMCFFNSQKKQNTRESNGPKPEQTPKE